MTASTGANDVERVRESTDLARLVGEYVALTPKGREHVGLCPFHGDKSPSMHVVTHKGPGFYKCFACGASGDCFRFVMDYHKVDFREALQTLADRAGIVLSRQPGKRSADGPSRQELWRACGFARDFFVSTLNHPTRGKVGRDIVERRGINDAMLEAFQIGLAPPGFDNLVNRIGSSRDSLQTATTAGLLRERRGGDGRYDAFRNRLIFPIHDEMGRPVAFGARAIEADDLPKYLNSAETPIFHKSKTLYGLYHARQSIVDSGQAIVTEGYTDVIACHQAGITNVVGTLGTALTDDHARRIERLADTVTLVFDGDEAGQRAADRGIAVFFQHPIDVRICVLPGGSDPDELLAMNGDADAQANGKAAFEEAVAGAKDALDFKLDRFRDGLAPGAGLSARQRAIDAFLDDLAGLGLGAVTGVRRRLILDQLEAMLRVPANELDAQLAERSRTIAKRAGRSPRVESGRTQPAPPASSASASERTTDAPRSKAAPDTEPSAPLPAGSAVRARRLAERAFAAVVLYHPPVLRECSHLLGTDPAKAAEWLSDELTFRVDPAARLVAMECASWLLAMTTDPNAVPPRTGDLLTRELTDDLRGAIATLHFDGETRCGGETAAAAEILNALHDDLAEMIRRESHQDELNRFRTARGDSEKNIDSLVALIENRRQHDMPAAISRSASPSSSLRSPRPSSRT